MVLFPDWLFSKRKCFLNLVWQTEIKQNEGFQFWFSCTKGRIVHRFASQEELLNYSANGVKQVIAALADHLKNPTLVFCLHLKQFRENIFRLFQISVIIIRPLPSLACWIHSLLSVWSKRWTSSSSNRSLVRNGIVWHQLFFNVTNESRWVPVLWTAELFYLAKHEFPAVFSHPEFSWHPFIIESHAIGLCLAALF